MYVGVSCLSKKMQKYTQRGRKKNPMSRKKYIFNIYVERRRCMQISKQNWFIWLKIFQQKKTFSSQIQSFCIKMFIFSPNIYLSSSSGIIFCLLLCFAGESCELLTTKRNTNKQKQLNGKFIWKTVIYNIHLKPKFFSL